jgi:hypothetical protein
MKTLLRSSLAALLAVGALGQFAHAAASPDPTRDAPEEGPVYIDSVEILYLESFPVQVHLRVQGSLPTPCHEATWDVEQDEEGISVRLWSQADPEVICVQVLEPFEVAIPIGTFESASLPVMLNGEPVGRVEVGGQAGPEGQGLVGAGWSFGMCLGYCLADLAIDGSELTLTGSGREAEEPLFVHRGTLTALAQERIAAALEGLDGIVLEPVYGCPDCADGGAAYLLLAQDGVTSRHEMEYADPPAELAELHALAMGLISALETCESGDLVDVAADCEAWEG